MCGIAGYIGSDNAIQNVFEILKKLEYRGYDSSGIAYFKEDKIKIIKKEGELENLKKIIPNDFSNSAIGHTRWATHGKPNDTNSHPHFSSNGLCSVVHNGIIENFEDLQNQFNFKLKSETDSEIIAELFDYYFYLPSLARIKKVISLLKGSYALSILFSNEKDKIYCTKNHSPLVCAISSDGCFCSSDANALENHVKDFYILENNEIAVLENGEISFYNKNKQIKKQPFLLTENIVKNEKSFCSLMEKEIHEIPSSLLATSKEFDLIDDIFYKKIFCDKKKIYLIGCGTAYHSCLIGKQLIEKNLLIPASAEIASEFVSSSPILDKDTLCVFVSQSGETHDTLACLSYAKKCGAKTFAVTNTKNSSITFMADNFFITQAGIERAVASTKAYVCQVEFFYLLCEKIENKNLIITNIGKKLQKNSQLLLSQNFENLSHHISNFEKIFFIGRNVDYVTAKESSLKLKEITYINCIDIPSGELKHGTLALIDEKSLVITFITQKTLIKENINAIFEIISRKGKVLVFSPFNLSFDNPNITFQKLEFSNLKYSPIFSIIPMQLISLKISKQLGLNPDKPRNLAKSVTVG